MNLLNENNIIHDFFNKIGDIIISNLLFVFCSIPLITIGPALTALYHCNLRSVKGNNPGTLKTFFHAFKQDFWQALCVWLGILAAGFIVITNIQFLRNQQHILTGNVLLYLSRAVAVLLVILTLYIFPVIAAFSGKTTMQLRNAFILAFTHFPSTIAIAFVTIFPMYMTYQDLKLLPLYACCWFFFGFSITAYVNSILLYRMFKPFLDPKCEKTNRIVTIHSRLGHDK